MRFIIIFLFCSFLSQNLFAQNVFEVINGNGSYSIYHGNLLLTKDGGCIVSSLQEDKLLFNDLNFALSKLDKNGNREWDSIYRMPSGEFNIKVIDGVDGGYTFIGTTYSYPIADEDTIKDIIVIHTDDVGKRLWQKVYSGWDGYDIVAMDNSYLVLGNKLKRITDSILDGTDNIVYCLDNNGEMLWKTIYGSLGIEFPKCILYYNNNIYVSGSAGDPINPLVASIGYLSKLDKNGTLLWNHIVKDTIAPINRTDIRKMIIKNDKIFTSIQSVGVVSIDPDDGAITLLKEGVGLWFFTLTDDDGIINFSDLKLTKYNYYLDTIFQVNYRTFVRQFDDDVVQTSDGGYLVLYHKEDWDALPPEGDLARHVLLKTDCKGNYSFWDIDCNSKLPENSSIIIFPNPSSEYINIETEFKTTKIIIYSMIGQQILNISLPESTKQIINISTYPAGQYILKAIGNNSSITAKVIIK